MISEAKRKTQSKEETARRLAQLPLFKGNSPSEKPLFAAASTVYGQIYERDNNWIIDAQPFVMERVRRLFVYGKGGEQGKFTHSVVSVRRTDEVARDIQWLMGRYGFEVPDDLFNEINRKSERYDGIAAAMAKGDADILFQPSALALKMAEPPRPHQAGFVNLFPQIGRMLLGDDIGLGKTISTIAALCEPELRPALIVVPTHLTHQWQKQFRRFLPDASTHIIKGTKTGDLPIVDAIITTYTRLSAWQDRLSAYGIKTVVFDEVQDLRSIDTKKRWAARGLSSKAEHALGLSATPIYNLGGEIWSIMDAISPEALGTQASFLREWGSAGESIAKTTALHSYLKNRGLMLRRTKKDLGIESEPVTKEVVTLDGDLESLKQIQNVMKALALSVLSNEVGVSDKSARELDWKLRQATGIAKAKAVAQLVRMIVESGRKVFLAGWHREVYSIWLKELQDLNPEMYTGTESPSQKAASVKSFVSGKSKVFICSLRSGAGLDGLQEVCADLVFGELDWSPQVMEQVIGRLDREGQKLPVTAYFPVIDDGSDPFMLEVLGEKRSQHDGIIEGKTESADILASAMPTDRLRQMAEGYLASIGEAVPVVAPVKGLHAEIVAALRRIKVPVNTEREMQDALFEVLPKLLQGGGIFREVKIGERSRLDFLVTWEKERIAIECKIDQTGRATVYRQVRRYAEEASITGLIVFAPWSGVANFVVEGVPVSVVDWTKAKL